MKRISKLWGSVLIVQVVLAYILFIYQVLYEFHILDVQHDLLYNIYVRVDLSPFLMFEAYGYLLVLSRLLFILVYLSIYSRLSRC